MSTISAAHRLECTRYTVLWHNHSAERGIIVVLILSKCQTLTKSAFFSGGGRLSEDDERRKHKNERRLIGEKRPIDGV